MASPNISANLCQYFSSPLESTKNWYSIFLWVQLQSSTVVHIRKHHLILTCVETLKKTLVTSSRLSGWNVGKMGKPSQTLKTFRYRTPALKSQPNPNKAILRAPQPFFLLQKYFIPRKGSVIIRLVKWAWLLTLGSFGLTPLNKGHTAFTSYCTPSRARNECPRITSRWPFESWFNGNARTPPPVTYLIPKYVHSTILWPFHGSKRTGLTKPIPPKGCEDVFWPPRAPRIFSKGVPLWRWSQNMSKVRYTYLIRYPSKGDSKAILHWQCSSNASQFV